MSGLISRALGSIGVFRSLVQLRILDVPIEVHDVPRGLAARVREGFAAFDSASAGGGPGPSLRYRFLPSSHGYAIHREGVSEAFHAVDADDALFVLEKDITVQLQYLRKELCFFHAAALSYRGNAYMLAADSGRGKSTTTWALLHHGMGYLSDELSPIALDTLEVQPYPYSLCLKRPPPPSYPLPRGVGVQAARIHVPARQLPAPIERRPHRLAGIFFVDYEPNRPQPALRATSAGEAAARLYVTALNALAHTNQGMDAVSRIVREVPCHALEAAELSATCRLLRDALDRGMPPSSSPS